jgi:BirA family biotin operon repressor/biotin-[acetyl-CoA-carboxylase] ligase
VGDKKICGMLLEHDLRGNDISNTLVGIGINVNQAAFTGSAPNPISIFQLLGKETDRAALLRQFVKRYLHYLSKLYAGHPERLRLAYCRKLYRAEGFHPYKDKDGRFMAKIESLDNDGRLGWRDEAGKVRHYYFKEVAFL